MESLAHPGKLGHSGGLTRLAGPAILAQWAECKAIADEDEVFASGVPQTASLSLA